MKRFLCAGVALLGCLCLLFASPVSAGKAKKQEKEVTIEQVPAKVKATILREAGQNKVTEIEETSVDGKVVYYEAESKIDGKEVEITVAPDGKLLKKQVGDDEDDDDDDAEDDD